MTNKRLESLVNKLTPSIRNTKPNTIYGELVTGPMFESLSKVLDAKSFVILSFLIHFKKNNKYTEGMSAVINDDLFTFSLIEIDQTFTEWECDECYGDGYVSCSDCRGNGEEECRTCDGSGDEECSACDGEGEDEDGGTCQTCDGNGGVDCDECGGRGWSRCGECGGDGSVNCEYCDGEGRGENEDRYEVTQRLYASIDSRLFNLLKDLDDDDVINEEVEDKLHDLKLTIQLNIKTYETEYFTDNGVEVYSEDVVYNDGLNVNPNLYYWNYRVDDREFTTKD